MNTRSALGVDQSLLVKMTGMTKYFIPLNGKVESQRTYLIRKFVVDGSFAILFIVLLFLANRIRLNGLVSIYSISLACAALGIAFIPIIMKFTGSIKASAIALLLVLAMLIMVLSFTTGGPFSPSLLFIPAFPLCGFLFVSSGFGGFLGLLFFIHLLFLSWAYSNGLLPAPEIEQSAHAVLNIASTIAVAFIFVFIGVSHVRWNENLHESLLRASRAKSEFLSSMSHELRTPLNSIVGFSDLLSRGLAGELNNKQAVYSTNIFKSSQHMLALVNDLLNMAKIESSETEMRLELVEPENMINECTQMMIDLAADKEVQIVCVLESSIKYRTALLDAVKFKQIVLNLLSNAIKFAPEQSKVMLNAAIVESHIELIVRDEGDGIPADYWDKVFDKFYQLEETGNRVSVGTGLGLPISRHFAELHDGTLDLLHDRDGKGACFKLTIPLKTQEKRKYES